MRHPRLPGSQLSSVSVYAWHGPHKRHSCLFLDVHCDIWARICRSGAMAVAALVLPYPICLAHAHSLPHTVTSPQAGLPNREGVIDVRCGGMFRAAPGSGTDTVPYIGGLTRTPTSILPLTLATDTGDWPASNHLSSSGTVALSSAALHSMSTVPLSCEIELTAQFSCE